MPPVVDDLFAANMLRRRQASGMSRADLVRELARDGWEPHQTTITRIEKGEQKVRLAEAIAIANALNTELSQLLLPVASSDAVDQLSSLTSALEQKHYEMFDSIEGWLYQRALVEQLVGRLTGDTTPAVADAVQNARAALSRTLDDALRQAEASLREEDGRAEA